MWCGRLAGMTHTLRSSSQDLRSIGDCADPDASVGPALPPAANGAVAAHEALVALARLLGRQAARAHLRGEDKGVAGSPLAGDASDVRSQTPFPATAQTDASSDPA